MSQHVIRNGLRVKYNNIDDEIRNVILEFSKWLRKQINFPIRVVVYVKKEPQVRNLSGELVYGTFFAPDDKGVEPYIRVATGDYYILKEEWGRDNALGAILHTLAHEIAHYDQWVTNKPLNCKVARSKATRLINKYAETREHP